jgi:alkylhydroperoxidase family enzyme
MRIPLVDPRDPSTDPSTAALLSGIFDAWGTEFNVLKAVANNGQVLEAYATFLGGVYAGLPADERELAYLTAAIVNDCHY